MLVENAPNLYMIEVEPLSECFGQTHKEENTIHLQIKRFEHVGILKPSLCHWKFGKQALHLNRQTITK